MKRKQTTTQKGLGYHHQQHRKRLLLYHQDGTPCPWCGRPMYKNKTLNHDGLPLAADHEHARAHGGQQANRLLHSTCNSQRGDGTKPNPHKPTPKPTQTNAFNWGNPQNHRHLGR